MKTRACIHLILAGLLFFSPANFVLGHEIIVTNHVSIPPGQKWNPKFWIGNLDDPVLPPQYRPNDKHRLRKWHCRNPGHNWIIT